MNNSYNLVENAWDLKNLMIRNRLIMVYADEITNTSYEYLLQFAEHRLEEFKTDIKNKKKILHIMVEAVQNIVQHGLKGSSADTASLFVIGMDETEKFFVLSGNAVDSENENYLREKLDRLNSLDPEQLRELYKHTIQHTEFSEKGGAGLGFIDIMRKSQSKLHYHFTPINNKHSFFSFKVNIARNSNGIN